MAKCLKVTLEDAFPTNKNVIVDLEDENTSFSMMDQFENWWDSAFARHDKVLIHVDDHRKMFEGAWFEESSKALLRNYALSWLARLPNVSVVLTCTDVPDVPSSSSVSWEICRRAVAMPPLDIDAIINSHPELSMLRWEKESEVERNEPQG